MKVKKEALRAARLLLKASMPGGRLDVAKAREFTGRIVSEKPRHHVQILEAFQRMLRLELDKRHAVIESAVELDQWTRNEMLNALSAKFGADLTSEFRVNPELLGGSRIKVGSTIWDGSVRSRLDALRQSFGA